MLVPELYWVTDVEPHRLALMPRPRGGEWLAGEVAGWQAAGVGTVVSLLEPAEVEDLELELESSSCEAHGIQFVSLPIPDRGVPESAAAAAALVGSLVSQLRSGVAVAIHCRAGIGRTGLVAGCVLHELGVPATDIFTVLTRTRGFPVPDTPPQLEWVRQYVRESSVNASPLANASGR